MHKIKIDSEKIRTDLIVEQNTSINFKKKIEENEGIQRVISSDEKGDYTTIEFQDVTDKTSFERLQITLKKELERYINPRKEDRYLIIGLGNEKSTPDSLGPKVLKEILVTRYLFLLGEVEEGYSNVSIFKPDVCGNTGIESPRLIKKVIEEVNPTKVIAIDALKAGNINRLTKTIQITNTGIHPGSGILNDQGEISKETIGCEVIAIGIPTVVDIHNILDKEENYMVTPTNIDYIIEKLSYLLGDTINKTIHKSYLRQIKK